MWILAKKEFSLFFTGITGYLAVAIFLLVTGLLVFVLPGYNLLDYGYATLEPFFSVMPYIMLFIVPTVCMRSFADEYRFGTFEVLKTLPFSIGKIVGGKFTGCLMIVLVALMPTLVYIISIQQLSVEGGIDLGATAGSYIGLFLLTAVYAAIGIFISSFTANTVIAFIAAAFCCFLFYEGFDALTKLPVFSGGWDYYIEMLGIRYHYNSISRGVISLADILYFTAATALFLLLTRINIEAK